MLRCGDVIAVPDAYSDGEIVRLKVTMRGGVDASTNGIVAIAVRVSVVCLSVSESGLNVVVLDAVAFVGSRTQSVGRAVSVRAFDDPSYATESATVALSNCITDGANCADRPAPITT